MATKKRVLLGCTGSVATIKVPEICKQLTDNNIDVRIVVTENSKHFLKTCELPTGTQILSDTVEWAAWQDRGDPVLHIDLSKWADLFLIAPLDANTLGKLSSGICDNILTCVARAWDPTKPLLFCPAMNTMMWKHPVTAPQVNIIPFNYKLYIIYIFNNLINFILDRYIKILGLQRNKLHYQDPHVW